MRTVFLTLTALALLCAGCGARPSRSVVRRGERPAPALRCGRRRRAAGDYGWPVKPFDEQHPIRGGFGDPRTMSKQQFGDDEPGDPGDYSFHNGLDIAAKVGTRVYPVANGRVHYVDPDEISVRSRHHRVFLYFHLRPWVRRGERVLAGITVLGTIKPEARHVHLTEIDRMRVVDPLLHLRPYADHTVPVVRSAAFETRTGGRLDPEDLTGLVTMTAQADDAPPLPVPGAWAGFPLAPALVRAQLVSAAGRTVWARTVADFRRTEPPKQEFWTVYGAGTYQNFPVFDDRFYWHRSGKYVFLLTRHGLDTRRFANGGYTLRVEASDECGNTGTLSERVRISN